MAISRSVCLLSPDRSSHATDSLTATAKACASDDRSVRSIPPPTPEHGSRRAVSALALRGVYMLLTAVREPG